MRTTDKYKTIIRNHNISYQITFFRRLRCIYSSRFLALCKQSLKSFFTFQISIFIEFFDKSFGFFSFWSRLTTLGTRFLDKAASFSHAISFRPISLVSPSLYYLHLYTYIILVYISSTIYTCIYIYNIKSYYPRIGRPPWGHSTLMGPEHLKTLFGSTIAVHDKDFLTAIHRRRWRRRFPFPIGEERLLRQKKARDLYFFDRFHPELYLLAAIIRIIANGGLYAAVSSREQKSPLRPRTDSCFPRRSLKVELWRFKCEPIILSTTDFWFPLYEI